MRSRKMPTTSVRRRISLLWRVVGADLFPVFDGERGEGEHVGLGGLEQRERVGELRVYRGAQFALLAVHCFGVGLFETLRSIPATIGHACFGVSLVGCSRSGCGIVANQHQEGSLRSRLRGLGGRMRRNLLMPEVLMPRRCISVRVRSRAASFISTAMTRFVRPARSAVMVPARSPRPTQ